MASIDRIPRTITDDEEIIMTATITTAELATELDTDPRTLRKFLRSEGSGVGKGSRYALPGTKREINALAKKFAKWDEARNADTTPESDNSDNEE
jgi:CO/xanthine dehydrogenase Mo-binding subunit